MGCISIRPHPLVGGGGDMQIGDLIKQARVFSSYPRSVASVLETAWMQQLIAVVGLLTVGEGAAGYYKDLNSLGGGGQCLRVFTLFK